MNSLYLQFLSVILFFIYSKYSGINLFNWALPSEIIVSFLVCLNKYSFASAFKPVKDISRITILKRALGLSIKKGLKIYSKKFLLGITLYSSSVELNK